jgi:hypothetical protein
MANAPNCPDSLVTALVTIGTLPVSRLANAMRKYEIFRDHWPLQVVTGNSEFAAVSGEISGRRPLMCSMPGRTRELADARPPRALS